MHKHVPLIHLGRKTEYVTKTSVIPTKDDPCMPAIKLAGFDRIASELDSIDV